MIRNILLIGLFLSLLFSQELSKKVEFESYSHQERIKILEIADNCIKNAQSKEEYQKCEQIENHSRKELKNEIKTMKKNEIINNIDSRIEKLKNMKECINNASTHQELKSCRKKNMGK